ncbi:hypothetical protein [Ancylobacter oerskovii]|uniref:Uncharacterized protein n=1 Tax=Ancylobacter oerskovii TaxID=459519 RepID=A0ABW4YSP4_9HYPH|nr:hypothetical protein [Ancylobacter oerskovii]MBS7545289.1 hypothetical protein [Ancylobacter oerskovii]
MQLWRVPDPQIFDEVPEWRMDLHLARGGAGGEVYLVIGGLVAVKAEELGTPVEPVEGMAYFRSPWLHSDCPRRLELFEEWLDYLWPVPKLAPVRSMGSLPMLELQGAAAPASRLPEALSAPAVLAGALLPSQESVATLPFATRSGATTIVHRWEAFPASRRCRAGGSLIAPNSFAAPELERPFVPSGFAAVARQRSPSPLPACFLYTLEPSAASVMECGVPVLASAPAGGGVELRFPHRTPTRAPIAEPAVLPPL